MSIDGEVERDEKENKNNMGGNLAYQDRMEELFHQKTISSPQNHPNTQSYCTGETLRVQSQSKYLRWTCIAKLYTRAMMSVGGSSRSERRRMGDRNKKSEVNDEKKFKSYCI